MNRWLDIIHAHPRAKLACDRVRAVVNGKRPDRIPFSDSFWEGFARRYREDRGLHPGASLAEHFDFDYAVVYSPVHGPWPGEAGPLGRDAEGYLLNRNEYGLVTREIEGATMVPQHMDCKQIAREVYRVLSACTDGHYMTLSAHSIAPDVSSDSYDYFHGLMDRYGRYPLDLDGLKREI